MNYPRRQQYRRLSHAGAAAAGSAAAALLGLVLAGAGARAVAVLAAAGLALYACHWLSLASRSGVGARSEDEVRHLLTELEGEGWRLRHSLPWRGRGDIDSLAIAPTRIVRHRDQDEELRRSPPLAGARPGDMAVASASALVSTRRDTGAVHRPLAWHRAA
ncbi:MAG: hypothetical protein ACJ780_10570 [Solirubrobacteraceae bacterium]